MIQTSFNFPQKRDLFLKTIVSLANGVGGVLKIKNIDMKKLKSFIEDNIYPIPDYWLKMEDDDSWIVKIDSLDKDCFIKEEFDYGFKYIRYLIKSDEIVAATKQMKDENSFKRKYIKFICKSVKGSYIIDSREIEKRASDIIEDLLIFVKRNINFSESNGWDFDFDILKDGLEIVLDENSYYQNFPIEFVIIEGKRISIKYLLGKELYDGNENFDIEDEIFLENRIRTLIIHKKNEKNIIKIDKKEKEYPNIKNIKKKKKKIRKLDILLKAAKTPATTKELMDAIGLKDRETFYNNYLKPAIKEGYINYTIPDKPRSPKQRYVISERMKSLIS